MARLIGTSPALAEFFLCLAFAVSAPLHSQEPTKFLGHWEGEIELPGAKLQIKLDIVETDAGLGGTIDIPAQGAKGLPLTDFDAGADRLRFQIQGIPGRPTFDGRLAGQKISGDFSQGGGTFPFSLGRDSLPGPNRPQEPKPPYPYDEEEAAYGNGKIELAGTLTLPGGDGPFPAALLITGSGPQNRNEELLGHKPFLVLADHLTRAGIAVLRVDDRGVGGSSGSTSESTSEDFAGDVLAGIAWLKAHPRIRRDAIGVIGHSEGGLVGPMAASRSSDVAYVVMLAGPGVSGRQILQLQMRLVASAGGMPPAALEKQSAKQEELLDLMANGSSDDEVNQAIRALVSTQMESVPQAQRPKGEELEQAIRAAAESTNTPWFRFFVGYDPAPALRQVTVPVLALNGELDLQVDADQNIPAIERALAYAGNEDVTTRRMPQLNHLFQHAVTGAVAEYQQIEETMSTEVLELIEEWILERFGSRAP